MKNSRNKYKLIQQSESLKDVDEKTESITGKEVHPTKRVLRSSMLLLIIYFNCLSLCHSQNNSGSQSWLPRNLSFDLSANGQIGFGKIEPGFAIGQIRLWSNLELKDNLNIAALFNSDIEVGTKWYQFDERKNYLAQLYLQYYNNYKTLPGNLNINANFGKLEWYPTYTDPLLISENLQPFYDPTYFYGADFNFIYSLFTPKNLSVNVDGYAGKIINGDFDFNIEDAYLRYRQEFIKDFGVNAQAGKAEETKYLVNEAYIFYRPNLYKTLRLDLRAGKLAGIDDTPYGIRIGGELNLKYISVGCFFEQRINQPESERYLVFYWGVTAPKTLTKILNRFNFIYDFNTNSLLFNIPFLNLKFF